MSTPTPGMDVSVISPVTPSPIDTASAGSRDESSGRQVDTSVHYTQDMQKIDGRSTQASVDARQAGRVAARNGEPLSESAMHNTQKYANSVLATDPSADAYALDPDKLFNCKEPNLAIISERPEHRAMVYMRSRGLSYQEVAQRTGYSVSWVSQICRQPWFKHQLIRELKEAGQDQLAAMFQMSALDSIMTIIDIRDDVNAPKAVRLAASNSVLDRVLGKPTQHIESKVQQIPSTEEITSLNAQIAASEKRLNELHITP